MTLNATSSSIEDVFRDSLSNRLGFLSHSLQSVLEHIFDVVIVIFISESSGYVASTLFVISESWVTRNRLRPSGQLLLLNLHQSLLLLCCGFKVILMFNVRVRWWLCNGQRSPWSAPWVPSLQLDRGAWVTTILFLRHGKGFWWREKWLLLLGVLHCKMAPSSSQRLNLVNLIRNFVDLLHYHADWCWVLIHHLLRLIHNRVSLWIVNILGSLIFIIRRGLALWYVEIKLIRLIVLICSWILNWVILDQVKISDSWHHFSLEN